MQEALEQTAPVSQAGTEATFLPDRHGGGWLLLWRRDGAEVEGTRPVDLLVAGTRQTVAARILTPHDVLSLRPDAPDAGAATYAGFADLVRFAREIVARGRVRPSFPTRDGVPHARWCAVLDAPERRLLVSLVARLPPAAIAASGKWLDADPQYRPETPWSAARAFVDGVIDTLVRAAPHDAPKPIRFDAIVERALVSSTGEFPKTSLSPRQERALERWEERQRDRETPPTRLVLQLQPPEGIRTTFRLAYLLEPRDPFPGPDTPPLPLGALWRGDLEAHLLADRLEPLRRFARTSLERVGRHLAPVEVSLASAEPEAALLTAEEAWALVARHQTELGGAGVRLVLPRELDDLESRFPKARVRLERTDGLDPHLSILAPTYRVRWEVVTGESVLTSAELRSLARQGPVVRRGDVWLPITEEAGERLAKISERPATEWTGPQALGAALAGEVRAPGDLSDAQVVPEAGLATLLDELRQDVSELSPPTDLRATLRGYQIRGLSWLAHRTRLGLGALLADDMGLGKTVQVIALLLHLVEKEAPGGPTLVVCPASLVGNWERELAKFAPSLRIVRHHGNDRARDAAALGARAGDHDVVVTTYGLVRRDEAVLAGVSWGTVILDEAQNIKNPASAQAKSVRSLRAMRRIVLSGTPVENRLTELWSLSDFANPALLGPLERFRREIALPIEKDRDARAMRRLQAATAPFLLRRMKTDPAIVPELPEKEEFRVVCALTAEQAKLYEEAVHDSLATVDDLEGIERSGRVLKLLTALKQICNHPAQYLHEERDDVDAVRRIAGRSGKLERAAEILEEIVASGEKALIFTQYVDMGTRLSAYLSRRLGSHVPLFHGGLSLAERDQMVAEFQSEQGGPQAMILSLRAGGVGLNLTRASHVIHYDRWWNPAVENQATDRAYRIGQSRRVQVHYLLTMGTLEERIDRLLEEKRALADSVVSGGEAWLTQLSTDQLRALVSLGSDAAVESLEVDDA